MYAVGEAKNTKKAAMMPRRDETMLTDVMPRSRVRPRVPHGIRPRRGVPEIIPGLVREHVVQHRGGAGREVFVRQIRDGAVAQDAPAMRQRGGEGQQP
jgi:hypothetical protein